MTNCPQPKRNVRGRRGEISREKRLASHVGGEHLVSRRIIEMGVWPGHRQKSGAMTEDERSLVVQ